MFLKKKYNAIVPWRWHLKLASSFHMHKHACRHAHTHRHASYTWTHTHLHKMKQKIFQVQLMKGPRFDPEDRGNKRERLQELWAATAGQREDGAKLSIWEHMRRDMKTWAERRWEKTEQDQKGDHGRQMFSPDRRPLHPSKPSGKPTEFYCLQRHNTKQNCQYRVHNDFDVCNPTWAWTRGLPSQDHTWMWKKEFLGVFIFLLRLPHL